MSNSSVLLIAVVVIAALAVLFVASASSRRDRAKATGFLSRETAKRDKSRAGADDEVVVSGRDIEREAALERRGVSVVSVPAAPAPVALPVPMDEATLGVTRRQFLNRGIVTLMTLSVASFGATCLAFLWPTLTGGF